MNIALLKTAAARGVGYRRWHLGEAREPVTYCHSGAREKAPQITGPAISYFDDKSPQACRTGFLIDHPNVRAQRERIKNKIRLSWASGFCMII